jgi:glucokinase
MERESKIKLSEFKNIGIGIPGMVDDENGVVVYCPNVNFKNIPLRKEIQKYINLPVYIGNDANCAALAESIKGASKGVKNSIMITLGTGVGGGIIINKKLYTGFNGSAAELGHMVIMVDGETCGCGRKGCFEAYASGTALINQAKRACLKHPESLIANLVENNLDKINAKIPFDAAKKGDKTAEELINQYIKYLSEGLTNLINIFQPEIVVIGGGINREGEYLLKPLKAMIKERVYGRDFLTIPEIKVAQLGNDAGIVGAAMLGK